MAVTILSGVYPILATPFRADRAVDVEDLARLIDFIIDSGADGIVFPGVASEFETLEAAERTHLVDVVAAPAAEGQDPWARSRQSPLRAPGTREGNPRSCAARAGNAARSASAAAGQGAVARAGARSAVPARSARPRCMTREGLQAGRREGHGGAAVRG